MTARVTALGRILMETSFSAAGLYWWAAIFCRRRRYNVAIAVCPPMQGAVMHWLYGIVRRVPWMFHIFRQLNSTGRTLSCNEFQLQGSAVSELAIIPWQVLERR